MTAGFTKLSLFGTENKELRREDVRTSRRSNEKWDSSVFFLLPAEQQTEVGVETFSPFQHINQLSCLGLNVKMPPACDWTASVAASTLTYVAAC